MTRGTERCIIEDGILPARAASADPLIVFDGPLSRRIISTLLTYMKRNFMKTGSYFGLFLSFIVLASDAAAQSTSVREPVDGGGYSALYWTVGITLVGLGAAYFFWRRSRTAVEQPKDLNRYRDYYRNESFELEAVDATQELEWLRKAKKKTPTIKYTPKATASQKRVIPNTAIKTAEVSVDTKIFQEKMKMLQYAQLPINSFNDLSPAKKYDPLPISSDRGLLTAIEQANEEFEEDEAIRELAVRILAAFRTQNSVEALTQMALYDLSSNLRAKSVSILTDFDHESVFEGILLACADPTREVRAAAARGLFRLNFDRSDAWKRIMETRDEFRMRQAVRAGVEAEIVQKSFDRLVHEDLKVAYEAFTLVALMIKANETKEIFDAIREHRDERVRLALLHVLKVMGDPRTHSSLLELLADGRFSDDVIKRIKDVVRIFDRVAV